MTKLLLRSKPQFIVTVNQGVDISPYDCLMLVVQCSRKHAQCSNHFFCRRNSSQANFGTAQSWKDSLTEKSSVAPSSSLSFWVNLNAMCPVRLLYLDLMQSSLNLYPVSLFPSHRIDFSNEFISWSWSFLSLSQVFHKITFRATAKLLLVLYSIPIRYRIRFKLWTSSNDEIFQLFSFHVVSALSNSHLLDQIPVSRDLIDHVMNVLKLVLPFLMPIAIKLLRGLQLQRKHSPPPQ